MWDWIWVGQDNSSEESVVEDNNGVESLQSRCDQGDPDADMYTAPSITHSVTFKCIGQLKERADAG